MGEAVTQRRELVVLFIGIVFASVTLTAVKDAAPIRHAALVIK